MGHGTYWQRAHLFKKIQTIRKGDKEKEEKDLPLPQERKDLQRQQVPLFLRTDDLLISRQCKQMSQC